VAYPSAELGGQAGLEDLRQAIGGLIERLGPADRVQLVLPALAGGVGQWSAPDDVRDWLAALALLPVRAGELDVPAYDPSAGAAYRFAPAGANLPVADGEHLIELPTGCPEVAIEAFGAAGLPDGKVRAFVAVRNQAGGTFTGMAALVSLGPDGAELSRIRQPFRVDAGRRAELIWDVPVADALVAQLESADSPGVVGAEAYLSRQSQRQRKVALIGPDEPLLRRFVEADETLQAVADVDSADFVLANRVDGPAGKPALVFDPPTSPAPWRRGDAMNVVSLDSLALADDPILRHVNLAGVAVRRVWPWICDDVHRPESLAFGGDGSFMLRSPAGAAAGDRRVYVAFDVSQANTNFGTRNEFAYLLANCAEFLAGDRGAAGSQFAYREPLAGGASSGVRRIFPLRSPADSGLLRWPGVYMTGDAGSGRLIEAVSLLGLRSAQPGVPAERAVRDATLPAPLSEHGVFLLWPILVALAGALWLCGWAMRLR